jgi:hypothetical protein
LQPRKHKPKNRNRIVKKPMQNTLRIKINPHVVAVSNVMMNLNVKNFMSAKAKVAARRKKVSHKKRRLLKPQQNMVFPVQPLR